MTGVSIATEPPKRLRALPISQGYLDGHLNNSFVSDFSLITEAVAVANS